MIVNEAILLEISYTLRQAIRAINKELPYGTDLYLIRGNTSLEEHQALHAQGRKSTRAVNKLRKNAGIAEIDDSANVLTIAHDQLGHVQKNELGHAKGVFFTTSNHHNLIEHKGFKAIVKKVAEEFGLDLYLPDEKEPKTGFYLEENGVLQ